MRCIAYYNSHSGYHVLYDVIMRSPVLSRAHLYCLHCIMAQRVGRPLTEVDNRDANERYCRTNGCMPPNTEQQDSSEWQSSVPAGSTQ